MNEEGRGVVVVVDASVAAKWYLPEELSEEASRFLEAGARGEATLVAPDLLAAELGNVLWHRQRRGGVSPERVREAWTAFEAAPLLLVAVRPLVPAALELAMAYGCTVYDGLYVALAEARGDAALLTADRRLVARFAGTTLAGRMRTLGG